MTKKKTRFRSAVFSRRWDKSYHELSAGKQRECDLTVVALIKGETSSGLRIKPIRPHNYYLEARVNSGDRVIHRVEDEDGDSTVFFYDVVAHDDIDRYGRRPKAK